MEYLIEYGMFLAKVATLVVAFVILLGAIISVGSRSRRQASGKGTISVVRLNDELEDMRDAMKKVVYDKPTFKHEQKLEKKRHKEEERERKRQLRAEGADAAYMDDHIKKRVYLLDFDGDIEASAVDSLREEITAVLTLATQKDEVILRLESPGGMVHAYGLASSQLLRIKDSGIALTICVDKVAASGGYMMACLADKLIAAPFAILGSIGVLVQLPNFNRLLHKHDVDYETITAGEYKTTLSTFGEITQKGRDKVKEDVEEMHVIFKDWVKLHRPVVDIDNIATGETWVGLQARDKNMIDEVMTSDECIVRACDDADVFAVSYEIRKSIGDRLGVAVHKALDRTILAWLKRARETSFYS
ncbi:MAG: protease SohB [Gammaproteobacteria bacterium]|nr:protease SohB [Gammaproteobacteria bacterium]MDP2141102.1 protease SohB [Gammaproteobacteria bacterium]MDP2349223.1 protease SohB [Gammaproteobacteria bacterium]